MTGRYPVAFIMESEPRVKRVHCAQGKVILNKLQAPDIKSDKTLKPDR